MVERIWCLLLEAPEKRYEGFIPKSPDLVLVAVVNVLMLCLASSSSNGDGADWLRLVKGAEENRRAVCQHLDDKELLQVILGCHTSARLWILNSLKFSTEKDSRRTMELLTVSEPNFVC